MQNAGQQYCQGGSTSHQNQAANFGQTEPSNTNNGGTTTSSLRQFRRKVEDKHQSQDNNQRQIPESHVARVAPQNHYPPRSSECYRYPNQYQDYSYNVPSQVKYSEISEPPQSVHQEHISPGSVIQKAKPTKDYMEICNPQHVVKQPYTDLHMNNQQQAYNDGNVLPQAPYIPKDTQVHPLYKPESQYFPKEPQYPAQLQHQMQKYNMPPTQMRKYPSSENEFLSKLQQINPMVARSIMSDHHLQEPQKTYQNLDQNRIYPMHHNQRYMNHPSTMQGNHYSHAGFMPPQPYPNYPSSCNFARSPQMTQPRFPSMSHHERSISPRRSFSDGMTMSMSYPGIPQKISPNYPQYNPPDFAQHYQQRRPSISQDYYQQHCRPTQYMPHQIQAQEMPESRVTVSDSIKQYIENWADEETASEMNQTETNRYNKDGLKARDDQLSETVYTINASELQYLEPLVESENGIPLVTSVSIDNTSGMIRIVDKNGQVDFSDHGERIVNVHIMEPSNKSDCMLASNKPNEINQRTQDPPFNTGDKSRIMIQQNTVIQSSSAHSLNLTKDQDQTGNATQQTKVGVSLPIITDEQDAIEEVKRSVIEECKKEVVDKNCSPINMEEIEALKEGRDYPSDSISKIEDVHKPVENDLFELNLPNIETYSDNKDDEKLKQNDDNKNYNVVKNVQDENSENASTKNEKESSQNHEENYQNSEKESQSMEIIKETVQEIVKNVDKGDVKHEIEKLKENTENVNKTELKNLKSNYKKETEERRLQTKEKNSKRSKRIFSVDDIINNIGKNVKKSRKETERRHSLHSVMEFLDKELNNTFVFDTKEKESETKKTLEENIDKNKVDKLTRTTKNDEKAMEATVIKTNDAKNKIDQKINKTKENNKTIKNNKTTEKTIENTKTDCIQAKKHKSDEASQSSQDVQFRNVIKVEESNVLLHIAGELVEINVTNVNGKKVITVTPMSSSTLVDFNDNYETMDSNDIPELLKIDEPEITNEETQVLEIESVVPEVDCVEPSSEVIIGMDLSLEEEIKLDVAQTQVLCTKAAKKAYDNDLQIPSITTSEDVNNKSDNYSSNDKVSSTKEKGSKDSSEESEDLKTSKSDREKLREFRKVRPHPKEDNVIEDDDDEFVPFKDLIKARKIKKMKMLELKKSEEIVKADSTNKEDEVIKESIVENKKCKTKDKKEAIPKASQDETKQRKTSSSKNRSTRDKNEKRHRDKYKNSDKGVKDKSRIEKKNTSTEKASLTQDLPVNEETTKKESPITQLTKKSDEEGNKVVNIKEDKIGSEAMVIKGNKTSVAEPPEKVQLGSTEETPREEIGVLVKTNAETAKAPEKKVETKISSADQPKQAKEPDNGERKKKLSLQEYNNRKRKLMDTNTSPSKNINVNDNLQNLSVVRAKRPKSLDDLDSLKEPEPSCSQVKRKFSLGSLAAPNHFDWDETQSPKRNLDIQEKRFSEFRGLIGDKSTMIPVIKQIEDKSLQNYKEKVQSKLSSLNIQIPKSKIINTDEGSLKNETSELMQKFLQNDKLTATEMEKIKKIISYKRLFQQLDKVNPQVPSKSVEIKNDPSGIDKDIKVNMKKQTTVIKKKKKRFRNLYGSVSNSDSEDVPVETKNSTSGDYSVVQSNCLAGVVPKLIIKRRPEMPLPFVKLERLDLDVLYHEKRVCIE